MPIMMKLYQCSMPPDMQMPSYIPTDAKDDGPKVDEVD